MLSVKELVIEICLSRKKEKKERPLTFISSPSPPLSFSFKFIFPSILPRIHQEFLTFRGSDFRGMRWIDFSFFVLAFTNRVNHAIDPQQWFSSYIQKKKSGKNLLESSFESTHICWSTERKILVARFEDHNIRRVAIPIKFSSLPKRHRSKSMARATIGIVGVKALCSCEFRNRRDYWARSGEPEGGRCRVKGLYVSLRKKNVDPLGPGQARPATVIHD